MRFVFILALLSLPVAAQPAPPSASAGTVAAVPVPASSITYLPKWVVTAGGGVNLPGNGKFAYWSASTYLGSQTYATAATEYTLVNKQVLTCGLAGISKPLYEFGPASIGLTGLGGGCTSTNGAAVAAASGQGFIHIRLGKSGWGVAITGMKTSGSAFKITLGATRASQ